MIKETKKKVAEMKQKKEEILTKITTAEDSSQIESYKAELTSITTTIAQSKVIIKTSTETRIRYEESRMETESKMTDLKNKVETVEKEAE